MPHRTRIIAHALAPALALVLALLVPAAPARANAAYDRVATAYAQGGGQLDACAFTQQQLEDAIAGIPKAIAKFVPDLRTAMRRGIAEHKRGECKGRTPGTSTSAAPPPVTTPTTPTTPQPSTATPATSTPATPAAHHHDRTPLVVAAAALGALALLLLLLWLTARGRGWDPAWLARQRHAWGEAGFRATSTWSEFADWLRLGR
jgi:hypothetical protein